MEDSALTLARGNPLLFNPMALNPMNPMNPMDQGTATSLTGLRGLFFLGEKMCNNNGNNNINSVGNAMPTANLRNNNGSHNNINIMKDIGCHGNDNEKNDDDVDNKKEMCDASDDHEEADVGSDSDKDGKINY